MKKNSKGFTLVELLSVIVLIGLLLGIGIPGVNRIRDNMNKKSLNTKINLIEQAAVLWGQDHKTMLQASSDCKDKDGNEISCNKKSIESLIEDDYLDSEDHNSITYKNPVDNSELKEKCVYIYKKSNRVYAYFSVDNNCYSDATGSGGFTIDTPTIKASDNKSSGEWHKADFNLEFTASSGTVIKYGYAENDVNTQGTSLSVNEETSSKTVYVKACKGDVCSDNAIYGIKLDKTSPSIAFAENPITIKLYDTFSLNDVIVNLTDDISGVKNTTYSGNVNTSSIGTYEIVYTSVDNAGNSTSATLTINVKGETVFVTNYRSSGCDLNRCEKRGTSWSCEDVTSMSSGNTLGVSAVDENTVFVTSYKSSNAPLYRCKKSGTWGCETVTSMSTGNTLGVSAVDENTVFVTSYKSSNAPLYRCKKSGTSWGCETVTSMNTGNTLGVSAVDENTVFVTSYKSSNAPLYCCKKSGTSWGCETVTSMNTGNTLGVSAVDENTVFVTSYKSSNAPLYRCKKSGTWGCETVTSMSTGNTLGVSAVDENIVFVSNSSKLKYCKKSGTWGCEDVTSMSSSKVLWSSAVDNDTVFVSNSSKLRYCKKNGTSWSCEDVTSMSTGNVLGVSAVGSKTSGYALELP